MANKFRGEADLVYERDTDAGPRTTTKKLVYDANALCEIEEAIEMNLGELLEAMSDVKQIGMRTVRGILYGGLQKNHPAPSVQEGLTIAGDIISDAGFEDTMEAIQKAMGGAMPGKRKGKAAPKAKAAPQTTKA